MHRQPSTEAGFSLIEVLVAISVFVIGLLAIASIQVDSIGHNARSNTRSVSTSLAQGILETVLSYSELDNTFDGIAQGTVWDLDPATAATTITLPGAGTYSATWWVRTDTPVDNVARVDVTVVGPVGPLSRTVTLTGYKRFL